MDAVEQKLKALDSFKDWSNYLLVTTVAALGWAAEKDAGTFCTPWMKQGAVVLFALSVVFAILTLALIPHVAEDIKLTDEGCPSIYQVYWEDWFVRLRLTRLCFPQHIFFLLGILLYASGAVFRPTQSLYWFGGLAVGCLSVVFGLGKLPRTKPPKTE